MKKKGKIVVIISLSTAWRNELHNLAFAFGTTGMFFHISVPSFGVQRCKGHFKALTLPVLLPTLLVQIQEWFTYSCFLFV